MAQGMQRTPGRPATSLAASNAPRGSLAVSAHGNRSASGSPRPAQQRLNAPCGRRAELAGIYRGEAPNMREVAPAS